MLENIYKINRKVISVAPMMDVTHFYARKLYRMLCKDVLLYTEMVPVQSLLHQDPDRYLHHGEDEFSSTIVQLGGDSPDALKKAVSIVEQYGYAGVNLNLGCPSGTVQKGNFGACLMRQIDTVVDCIKAMRSGTVLPISVKCRIGVDEQEPSLELPKFIEALVDAGCMHISIHARKAWLKGLNPKQNREVPPLEYDLVYSMHRLFPDVYMGINGGIKTAQEIQAHWNAGMHEVMLGRIIRNQPLLLYDLFKGEKTDIIQIVEQFLLWLTQNKVRIRHVQELLSSIFWGLRGAKQLRVYIAENRQKRDLYDYINQAFVDCMKATAEEDMPPVKQCLESYVGV